MTAPEPKSAPAKAGPKPSAAKADKVTPMMAQYLKIKEAHGDYLLFYRMGDFYELFFEDAELAAKALDIVLTKRGRHLGEDIRMCGVPVVRAEEYLHKLIRAGFRVAVCEQTEDPAEAKKRGAKSVVRREVTRLVTPGTLTEDSLLDARRNNYLAALYEAGGRGGSGHMALAWADISTGEFHLAATADAELGADLARLEPGELLVPDGLMGVSLIREALERMTGAVTPLADAKFDSQQAERRLKAHFKVEALDAFGAFTRAELGAAGALLDYIETTQLDARLTLEPPRRESRSTAMLIDAATRANLELLRTLGGARKGSLIDRIDLTVTGGGARELAARLAAPLLEPAAIDKRLDSVSFLAGDEPLRADLRAVLKACPEPARALSRLLLARGGPRDLLAIRGALQAGLEAAACFRARAGQLLSPPPELGEALEVLARADGELKQALEATLSDEVPLAARDGGFVAPGFSAELDELRRLRDESRQVIAGLQAEYAASTGVKALKIRHNNVLGYFVEVTPQHADRLLGAPLNEKFIHRQTLASAVRFTTTELGETEMKIARAGEQALAVELGIFADLTRQIGAAQTFLTALGRALAVLDVSAALAELAVRRRYCRPHVDDSMRFAVRGGRHPVVEAAREGESETFVANDCDLNPEAEPEGQIWLLTGPNMAGKSTFLRQNALISILAQMGSFVPADEAHIGIVDRLFSRVGAADDLARGRSTFMVEMVETAVILNQAGPRALVILDEIGRGTATFDGLSIAWACVEHLHQTNRCRALFATHFHELTALTENLPRLRNATMKVREWKGEVIFLHEVGPGAADRSYGLQVARLAGLPGPVIERAGEVLASLEQSGQGKDMRRLADDLPLFSAARPISRPAARQQSEVEAELMRILPDQMSPLEALECLYRLKSKLDDG